MKKYLIPLLLGMATFCCATACKEFDELEGTRTITVSASFHDDATRADIEQVQGSLNLVTRWREDDKISLFLLQDGKGYTLEPVKVYDISSDGKRCSFDIRLPADISMDRAYDIYGLCDAEGVLWEEEGFVYAKSALKRMSWNNRIVPMWFHEQGGKSNIQANFLHLGTYEILHVTNSSKAGVTFRHDGFDVDEPWYKSSENTPLKEDYDPTHNVEEPGDDASSGSVFIPAGSTEKILSWYVPRGGTIIDATLLATINGNSVRSSNTKNSSVRIQRGHVYHMYATWDGNELKFGNANELPDELGIGFTHLDMQEDGAYGFTTGREGHLSFESTDPSVATAIETDDVGDLHVDIRSHTIGTAIITITDTDTGQKSQIEVVVRERTDFSAMLELGETDSVTMKNADGHYEAYSEDESIATCEVVGNIVFVTGHRLGETIIHVTDKDTLKQYRIVVLVYMIIPKHIPEAIDLGLPSGLKWASFNLGASKPEEYGDYFAWGETKPYYSNLDPLTWIPGKEAGYYWASYKWCNGFYDSLTKYCTISDYGYLGFTDGKTVLDPEDDAAYANLGYNWRIPTEDEIDELAKQCKWEWTSMNGISGQKITGPNGNSIFLPATCDWEYVQHYGVDGSYGSYWTSSLYTPDLESDFPGSANSIWVNPEGPEDYHFWFQPTYRCAGLSIRPVYDAPKLPVIEVTPTDIEFGAVPYGSSSTKYVTVKNIGTGVLTFSVTNVSAPYYVETNADGNPKEYSLSAGESMQLAFTFTPNSATYAGGGRCTIVSNATESVISVWYTGKAGEPASGASVPEIVDLGLPSGLKWASFNVGATKPEEYGDYYAWGEVEPYYSSLDPLIWKEGKEAGYNWPSYKWCMGSNTTLTKYCDQSSYGYNGFTDYKTVLDPEDDAAHVSLGGKWRMPTKEEWSELIENCTWTWKTQNGVRGKLVTAGNGNSIFIPAAANFSWGGFIYEGDGYYWSSSLSSAGTAWVMVFISYRNPVDMVGNQWRQDGTAIRPVYDDTSGFPSNPPPEGGLD